MSASSTDPIPTIPETSSGRVVIIATVSTVLAKNIRPPD